MDWVSLESAMDVSSNKRAVIHKYPIAQQRHCELIDLYVVPINRADL